MGKLQRKVAVITGGTEGIGLATAQLFVHEGAYVFITGRRQKELDEAVTAIGSNATGVQDDVAKLADLDRLYQTVSKVKGRIDIIFANAGAGEFVPLPNVSEEHFDKLFNINVKGALFTVQRVWTTDLKDRHIRSNVISPGPIKTPLTNRQSADVIARIVSTVPMGRMGEPDEVAKAALYLASDDSSFVTGVELFVDGGRAQI